VVDESLHDVVDPAQPIIGTVELLWLRRSAAVLAMAAPQAWASAIEEAISRAGFRA